MHTASGLTAAIIGQAVHVAAAGAHELLNHILGPSRDLRVWIPKASGARPTPANLRPLQLPTTIRR
eukprot:1612475-Prorocentrum_lima.AAC.1